MSRFLNGFLIAATALTAVPSVAQVGAEARRDIELGISPFRPQIMRMPISVEAADYQRENMKFAPGGDPLPVYLNRWGGTYYGGYDDSATDHSSIVFGSSATVGGFPGNDTQWNTVKGCVQDMFSRFNVLVTDVEPTDGDYVEAVVGGNPTELGMSWGVGGVAPYDPNTCVVISKAVVYAFAESYGTSEEGLEQLCWTVAQEVAHAFTLDHELLCEDPMTYLDGCGAKTFQDVYAPCGEFEERVCTCGEGDLQNSVQSMYALLGPGEGIVPPPPPDDREPPQLALLSPESEMTVLSNSTLEIVATATDDIGLVTVTLEWLYSDDALFCPGEGNGWSCSVNGDQYTWTVEVTEGLREFRVRARDVMGKVSETETRWVWLASDLEEERPEDNTPPEIYLVSPGPDEYIPMTQEQILITAAVYDADTGVAEVGLVRSFGGGQFVIPCIEDSQDERFRCERVGGTYTWYMNNRRAGSRDWSIYAKDFLGNEIVSETRTYHAVESEVETFANDGHENNNTWDLAEDLACGTALDLRVDAHDADWFTVQAPVGMFVDVKVTGDIADRLRLSAHSSPTIDGVIEHLQAKAGFEVPVPEEGLKIRVTSNGSVEGDYRLQVACRPPALPPVNAAPKFLGVCSHVDVNAGPGALFGVLALLGLALAGRRRR